MLEASSLKDNKYKPLRSAGPPPATCPVLLFNEKIHFLVATAGGRELEPGLLGQCHALNGFVPTKFKY